MPTVELTQTFIASDLRCPPEKPGIYFYCSRQKGLAVYVSRGRPGRGLFRLQCKVNGKSTWTAIGSTEDMTLKDARKQADLIKAQLLLTPKPSGSTHEPKAVPTLREFFKRDYLPHVKPRKRSWKRDEELFRLRLDKAFGAQKLDCISRQAVQAFHALIKEQGLSPATADHHVKLLRSALNLAVQWGFIDRNPVAGIKLFNADNKVENVLSDAERQRLLQVLATDGNRTICRLALFLLSTGARLNEALSAQWEHVNEESRVWRIPAAQAKSKRMRSIPLNDSALQVLGELGTKGVYEHLFVNLRTGKRYTSIMKVWSRLREKAGLQHLRVHDLRHNFASLLVENGRTLYEVQTILGHSDPKVTMRYAHLSNAGLVQAAQAASVLQERPPLQLVA